MDKATNNDPYYTERLEVAELFADSLFASRMSQDELASFPHCLFFASIFDVRELKKRLEDENEHKSISVNA